MSWISLSVNVFIYNRIIPNSVGSVGRIKGETLFSGKQVVLVVVLFCLLGLPAKPAQHTLSDMDRFLSYVEGTLDALPISYLFTLFAVSTLMVTDYYLRRTLKATY